MGNLCKYQQIDVYIHQCAQHMFKSIGKKILAILHQIN